MRHKVVLHGALRNLGVDGPLEFEGQTPHDALRALFTQAKKQFQPKPGQLPWRIRVIGFDDPNTLMLPANQNELHVVPDFNVGKDSGGFLQIVIGVVIIAAAIIAAPYTGGLSLGLVMAGALSILQGVIALISPAPRADFGNNTGTSAGSNPSLYLGTPQNTVAIGTRIPFGFGEFKVFGQYLSFDVQAIDIAL